MQYNVVKIRYQPITFPGNNTKAPVKALIISVYLLLSCSPNCIVPMAKILYNQPKYKDRQCKPCSHSRDNRAQYNASGIGNQHPKLCTLDADSFNKKHLAKPIGNNASEKPYQQ